MNKFFRVIAWTISVPTVVLIIAEVYIVDFYKTVPLNFFKRPLKLKVAFGDTAGAPSASTVATDPAL